MYIVNTIAVEYRSPKREREHHAKLDESHEFDVQSYTVNDKSDKHESQLREFIVLCPYANVCTLSSRM